MAGRKSAKTGVIEWIFFNRKFDSGLEALVNAVVTFDDITDAIRETGANLKTNNPANFWKDLTRGDRNKHWPASVFDYGYSAADAIGEGEFASFKFVAVPDGQDVPFPEALRFDPSTPRHIVQSLSMPEAMKALSRRDENWLTQVVSRLHVIETYFAVFSDRSVREVSFLQTGIKMRGAEVDAAFMLTADDGTWLVSAEAKGKGDAIHLEQIARAAATLDRDARSKGLSQIVGVIPFAVKVVDRSAIWVVEFAPVADPSEPLVVVGQGVIEFNPTVPGIY